MSTETFDLGSIARCEVRQRAEAGFGLDTALVARDWPIAGRTDIGRPRQAARAGAAR